MRRILFISHYFPPLGGAGVQRSVKYVKYLPEQGILPTVLTGPGSSSGWWSPCDSSLLQDIPPAVKIYRAEWPGAVFSSGERRENALLRTGEQAARENGSELIYVSMSPFQDARVARALSQRMRIPWIADLRDPWALDEFRVFKTRWHRRLEITRMCHSLHTASLVVMNTPEAAVRLRSALGPSGKRVIALTNGYDAEDFQGDIEFGSRSVFKIVHSGYLHTTDGLHQRRHMLQYRLLGRVEPGMEILPRSHFYLLQAIERWCREEPRVREKIKLVLVGRTSARDHDQAKGSSISGLVQFTGYLSHAESLSHVRTADLLFLPMHKMPADRRATLVPGKTYEYMATGLPVLAPIPEGDARDFLSKAGTGLLCEPDDVGGIVHIMKAQFNAWRTGTPTVIPNKRFIEQFERRRIASRLAAEMFELCQGSTGAEAPGTRTVEP